MIKFGDAVRHEGQPDRQRTPTYSQVHDIPVPESEPVAEFNKGELAAIEQVKATSFYEASDWFYARAKGFTLDFQKGYLHTMMYLSALSQDDFEAYMERM